MLVTGASSGIGRATAAERGLIVNVSTVGGRTPARGYHALYQGSKHALRAASEALVWELAR